MTMKRLVLGVAVLVSACGYSTESPQEFVARSGNDLRGQVAALPQPARYEPAAYTVAGLRDPFTLQGPQPQVERDARPREQLEAYSLDALRMMGTIEKSGTTFALVRSPDGTLHQVRAGSYMGLNSGRVAAVEAAAITLVEPVVEDGEKGKREVRLALAEALSR
jgi:type IV pilus assembly protein PilP